MTTVEPRQVFNPFLPLSEYIPDGEPHVFGDRLYLFGSHDKEGGNRFCQMGNYVVWSAPTSDLTDWRREGLSYQATQDPDYQEGMDLYAPDVVEGNDGRYYLYYTPSGSGTEGFHAPIKVAVGETPAGPYEYLGFVRNPDGTPFLRYITGDPAVINDDGVIRLYYGWSLSLAHAEGHSADGDPKRPEDISAEQLLQVEMMLFGRTAEQLAAEEHDIMGANHVVLADDMLTALGDPARIVPGQFAASGTEFEGHAFYEAASIRKVSGTYYFVYSSQEMHELVYATSQHPDRDFIYRGTIVSNGDIGIDGRRAAERNNVTGTNHGGIVQVGDAWYVFYHRMTHKSGYSRQACAERIEMLSDGSIAQVELTSCGLNGGPLVGQGTYPAPIASSISNGRMPHLSNEVSTADVPHVTHDGVDRFIADLTDGSVAEFKYFDFDSPSFLALTARGEGTIEVLVNGAVAAAITLEDAHMWSEQRVPFKAAGIATLAFRYRGDDRADMLSFTIA